MSIRRITSRDNPAYREWLILATDARDRRARGRTLLDGPHLLRAALEAGLQPAGLAVAEGVVSPESSELLARLSEVPVLEMPASLFKALSPVQSPTGLLATLDIPRPPVAKQNFVVLLESIQDPGNLGALLRVAAAAGVEAAYLSPGCTEAWSPKCLRGGQGAHFVLDIHEGADLPALAMSLPGGVHAAALGGQSDLYGLDLSGPVAFAFGNEGAGLSLELLAASRSFCIPMPGRVESLNVATAAAVCLFERVRQAGLA